MARKTGNGFVEVRISISEEFYAFAEAFAAREPLMFGPDDYLTMTLNTAMLEEMDRHGDRIGGTPSTSPPPREDGDDSDIPF